MRDCLNSSHLETVQQKDRQELEFQTGDYFV